VWDRLQAVIDGPAMASLPPKEKMTEALSYLRNHGAALWLYRSDPLPPIDNSDVEQLMKQVAVDEKTGYSSGVCAPANGRPTS
jgi:hypothetical protein